MSLNGQESRLLHERVQEFIQQLPVVNNDTSFEVRWSLSELEDIVFDFINAHNIPDEFKQGLPWEAESKKADGKAKKTISFANATPPPKKKQDVNKEELMNVKRGGKDENLPQMVRDYILHDRGNSLFLGDSFGNLPSPVAESLTMKKLFKFEDDDRLNKKRKNESKNQAIRVEGKKEKGEKVEEKKLSTPER